MNGASPHELVSCRSAPGTKTPSRILFELPSPGNFLLSGFVVRIAVNGVIEDKVIDACVSKTLPSLVRSAHDCLPTDIEACVDDHWDAGQTLELADQFVKVGMYRAAHGLKGRGAINMDDARQSTAWAAQLFAQARGAHLLSHTV